MRRDSPARSRVKPSPEAATTGSASGTGTRAALCGQSCDAAVTRAVSRSKQVWAHTQTRKKAA